MGYIPFLCTILDGVLGFAAQPTLTNGAALRKKHTLYVPRLVRGIQLQSEISGSLGQAEGRREKLKAAPLVPLPTQQSLPSCLISKCYRRVYSLPHNSCYRTET